MKNIFKLISSLLATLYHLAEKWIIRKRANWLMRSMMGNTSRRYKRQNKIKNWKKLTDRLAKLSNQEVNLHTKARLDLLIAMVSRKGKKDTMRYIQENRQKFNFMLDSTMEDIISSMKIEP